ncbi:MAG: XRE family transcriptional regulator [Mycobacterium sp.]
MPSTGPEVPRSATGIRQEGWTQAEAAKRLRVTQPRVSDLWNGKTTKFSLDDTLNV